MVSLPMLSSLLVSVGLVSHLITPVLGEETETNPASVFILPLENENANYTFAVNIPASSEDIYFHLSAPNDFSWAAVGTGSQMKDAMMFIVYASADGNNVTLSPRIATGEQEPVFSSSLAVTMLPGTGMIDNTLTVNARCSNCSRWDTGSLDLQSTSQSWIFALGPHSGNSALLHSDSPSANLEKHSEYGQFTVDMVHATGGSGGFPTSFSNETGAAQVGSTTMDSNWRSIIHALAVCAAFILLMPIGVFFLRVKPRNLFWHWVNQSLAFVLALIGGGLGVYISTMFNKSESFNSPHQVLGILIIVAMVSQWFLGFWHHRLYKMTHTPSKYGLVHRYFGAIVIFLAIINGGIGLVWSYASTRIVVAYSVLVAIISIPVIITVIWSNRTVRIKSPGQFSRIAESGQQRTGYESDIHLTEYADTSGRPTNW